jgi:hypothetical protein
MLVMLDLEWPVGCRTGVESYAIYLLNSTSTTSGYG